jgi:hypothetical protein
MIPKTGWKTMDTAPTEGEIIVVKFREWNKKDGKSQVQPAQWLPDSNGANWGWRKPWCFGTTANADEWMTFSEFQAAQAAEEAGTAQPAFDL